MDGRKTRPYAHGILVMIAVSGCRAPFPGTSLTSSQPDHEVTADQSGAQFVGALIRAQVESEEKSRPGNPVPDTTLVAVDRFFGSAFPVSGDRLITARHVYIRIASDLEAIRFLYRGKLHRITGAAAPGSLSHSGKANYSDDWCILQVDPPINSWIPLRSSNAVQTLFAGDLTLHGWTIRRPVKTDNPADVRDHLVAESIEATAIPLPLVGAGLFAASESGFPGMSGGCVVCRGEVVGMISNIAYLGPLPLGQRRTIFLGIDHILRQYARN